MKSLRTGRHIRRDTKKRRFSIASCAIAGRSGRPRFRSFRPDHVPLRLIVPTAFCVIYGWRRSSICAATRPRPARSRGSEKRRASSGFRQNRSALATIAGPRKSMIASSSARQRGQRLMPPTSYTVRNRILVVTIAADGCTDRGLDLFVHEHACPSGADPVVAFGNS